jgi:hypothetical protein
MTKFQKSLKELPLTQLYRPSLTEAGKCRGVAAVGLAPKLIIKGLTSWLLDG